MARSGNITVENNFTKGLITEYTAMNFPENAVTETDNCVYSELGMVTRRPGIDYEVGNEIHLVEDIADPDDTSGDRTFSEFRWFSVGSVGTTTFVVQQIDSVVRFFTDQNSISGNLKTFFVDMYDYASIGVTREQIAQRNCQFTTGDGYLFVTHPLCDPIYVSYSADGDNIQTNRIEIRIRDVEGLDDQLENDDRPSTLSDYHKYNLYNQGWGSVVPTSAGGAEFEALFAWDLGRDDYPSNADVWWLYKGNRGWVSFGRGLNPDDGVSPSSIQRGNSPAPRGHYIYSAFNVDRTTKTGVPGLPTQSAGSARPATCEWYAGRVWFAGVKSPKYSSSLYFSQLIEGTKQFGRCYQQNDPTSEISFDLVDTDGGVIKLPLVEEVVAMKVLGDMLIIIATNCVYAVSGTVNDAFKTTNYTVRYIGSIGARSHLSVVEAEGALLWWNSDGIYSLVVGQNGPEISNISKQTIQSFIEDIPTDNIRYVKGAYNKREQIVRWVFSSTPGSRFTYDKMLDLNLASKSFYPHSIGMDLAPRICGLMTVYGTKVSTTVVGVTDLIGTPVEDSFGLTTIDVNEYSGSSEVFKFTVTGELGSGEGLTYAELFNEENVDWESFDSVGQSYSSFGVSGYRIRGEMLRQFNSTPIAFVIKNYEDASCLVSGIWDYGERQTTTQELYRSYGITDNFVRRVGIRGRGKSFQIKFESVGNAPFGLIGWSTFDTGGTQP